jgi:Skp family chaperone for outer membrane proteins
MNNDNNNLLSFVLGAAIGGAAAYYLFKHKDEIIDKINDEIGDKIHTLEEHLHIDHNTLIDKAKTRLDALAGNIQSTIQRYTKSEEKASDEEIAAIMEELSRLREEVKALSANA